MVLLSLTALTALGTSAFAATGVAGPLIVSTAGKAAMMAAIPALMAKRNQVFYVIILFLNIFLIAIIYDLRCVCINRLSVFRTH